MSGSGVTGWGGPSRRARVPRRTAVRGGAVILMLALSACDEGVDVDVQLERPTLPVLDPYDPAAGVTKVRMVVRGDERGEEAIVDAEPGVERLSVEGFPAEEVDVEVFGFDAVGNVRAYGRLDRRSAEGGLSTSVRFRRNLAYVIHEPNAGQDRPEGVVYAIDVVTRTLVDRVRLEGSAPRATSITARGGQSLLLSVTDGFDARVVELSTSDHSTRSTPLEARPDLVLGVEASPIAVAVGGSRIAFVDLDAQAPAGEAPDVGGRVLDAAMAPSGNRVIAAVDVFPPGLLEIDVRRREVTGENIISNPAGIAVNARSAVAYLVSSENRSVVGYDLESGRSSRLEQSAGLAAAMGAPTGVAAYSDHMEGLFAVSDPGEGVQPAIYAFSVFGRAGSRRGIPTFFDIRGIASDGPGRRVLAVGAGTSSVSAGITVIDAEFNELEPESTNTLYPLDPEDFGGAFGRRQRYRPAGVAIVYGQ